jgi:hypothetical protein
MLAEKKQVAPLPFGGNRKTQNVVVTPQGLVTMET